jgi:hypothetical protein
MDHGDKERRCACGRSMSREDAEFWGECEKCRLKPAIRSRQRGDEGSSPSAADRRYHGGEFAKGEW